MVEARECHPNEGLFVLRWGDTISDMQGRERALISCGLVGRAVGYSLVEKNFLGISNSRSGLAKVDGYTELAVLGRGFSSQRRVSRSETLTVLSVPLAVRESASLLWPFAERESTSAMFGWRPRHCM